MLARSISVVVGAAGVVTASRYEGAPVRAIVTRGRHATRSGRVPFRAMTEVPRTDRARSLVVRVWLPDRPGALGQVASRIGGVHADVTAIDILERGGGRVIDELVVTVPGSTSVELLAKEIGAVDGVAVEHIRPVFGDRPDSATAILRLAADVAAAPHDRRLGVLVAGLVVAADADWVVAVCDGEVIDQRGMPPEQAWLLAFLDGSLHLDASCPEGGGPNDMMWAHLRTTGISIAAGRAGRAVHERERSRLAVLATIVDQLL